MGQTVLARVFKRAQLRPSSSTLDKPKWIEHCQEETTPLHYTTEWIEHTLLSAKSREYQLRTKWHIAPNLIVLYHRWGIIISRLGTRVRKSQGRYTRWLRNSTHNCNLHKSGRRPECRLRKWLATFTWQTFVTQQDETSLEPPAHLWLKKDYSLWHTEAKAHALQQQYYLATCGSGLVEMSILRVVSQSGEDDAVQWANHWRH